MNNVVSLHAGLRWKAVIEYRTDTGVSHHEHYFEEVCDLHNIVEHGPDWNTMVCCTLTLNRSDDGAEQNSVEKARREERLSTAG